MCKRALSSLFQQSFTRRTGVAGSFHALFDCWLNFGQVKIASGKENWSTSCLKAELRCWFLSGLGNASEHPEWVATLQTASAQAWLQPASLGELRAYSPRTSGYIAGCDRSDRLHLRWTVPVPTPSFGSTAAATTTTTKTSVPSSSVASAKPAVTTPAAESAPATAPTAWERIKHARVTCRCHNDGYRVNVIEWDKLASNAWNVSLPQWKMNWATVNYPTVSSPSSPQHCVSLMRPALAEEYILLGREFVV